MQTPDCHIVIIPTGTQRQPVELQSLLDCITIRERVFVEEQQVPLAIEQDGRDNEEGIKLERIAILKEFRGRHLGKLLIREGIRAVRMSSLEGPIYIHAQQQAASFYASLGFIENGEHTVEANIDHTTMFISVEQECQLLETDPCSLP